MNQGQKGLFKMNLHAEVREARKERNAQRRAELSRENKDFVQVYPKGWKRLQSLIQTNPSAARLYALIAENMDPMGGAVVASQTVLAEMLGVTDRTIRTLTKALEDQRAIIRIRVGAGTYAYALDPDEIWRAWDSSKDFAVFRTRTLVSKADKENGTVNRRIKMMVHEQGGQSELPLGFDPETGEVHD